MIIDRYKYALLIGVLLLLAAVFYSFAVSRTVARRTKKLVEVIDEKSELEKTARIDRERLSQLERAGFVSEISSMMHTNFGNRWQASSTMPTACRYT